MFRQAYKADLRVRGVDFALHCILAVVLPGHWWYQFIPDMLVPILWVHGMVTDRWLNNDNFLVFVHLMVLHNWRIAVIGLLSVCFTVALFTGVAGALVTLAPLWLWVHWLGHLGIDWFTHDGWVERKTW